MSGLYQMRISVLFAVSDVVFIQRCVILNSGVVPMAFLFGRGVVGPDSGNVGELLRVTANLVFSPSDQGSVNSNASLCHEHGFGRFRS